MGQCFSINGSAFPPSYADTFHQQGQANVGGGFNFPPFMQNEPQAIPTAPLPAQRSFNNRFAQALNNERHLFSLEQQNAIDNLEQFDSIKHDRTTNAQTMNAPGYLYQGDLEARQGLQRTASFNKIKTILRDIHASNQDAIRQLRAFRQEGLNFNSMVQSNLTRGLLVGQLEALHHQVQINTDDFVQKMATNARIRPLLTDARQLNAFFRRNVASISGVINACKHAGMHRVNMLETHLGSLAFDYLSKRKALPSGIFPGYTKTFGTFVFNEGQQISLKILTNQNLPPATYFQPDEYGEFALITISLENCTTAYFDPTRHGSAGEKFFSGGFDHCNNPEKQAAVFIMKLFHNLGYLEETVLAWRGQSSSIPAVNNTAAVATQDMGYLGSTALGDRHDEYGSDRENQRAELVNLVAATQRLAEEYVITFKGESNLVLDESLNKWVSSPFFEYDMKGIKHPEDRVWNYYENCVRSGLLQRPEFQPLQQNNHL